MVTVPVDTKELCTVHSTVNCTAGHLGAGSAACGCVRVSKCIKKTDNKELKSRQTAGSDGRKRNHTQMYTQPVMLLVSQEMTLF